MTERLGPDLWELVVAYRLHLGPVVVSGGVTVWEAWPDADGRCAAVTGDDPLAAAIAAARTTRQRRGGRR